jgi:hypothetical protein
VILGSLLYSLVAAAFASSGSSIAGDFLNHAIGAVLMGIGGVLSMGCTIGQGITGVSTLALGSVLTLVSRSWRVRRRHDEVPVLADDAGSLTDPKVGPGCDGAAPVDGSGKSHLTAASGDWLECSAFRESARAI